MNEVALEKKLKRGNNTNVTGKHNDSDRSLLLKKAFNYAVSIGEFRLDQYHDFCNSMSNKPDEFILEYTTY